jgi:hypothetical protein
LQCVPIRAIGADLYLRIGGRVYILEIEDIEGPRALAFAGVVAG